MNPTAIKNRTGAFTLIELLTVIAIIGILAALLLPVYNKSEQRAKMVWCGNDLSQVGLAFHAFSNDHGGKFPMGVSTNDGGSLEYVQEGYAMDHIGYFYMAFRNFQALSGELVKPELLYCPADMERGAATNFSSLQNSNLSYFVGVTATFDKPDTVMAGDRNVHLWFIDPPAYTMFKIDPNYYFGWFGGLHNNQGNLLFSDGHVLEESDGETRHETANLSSGQVVFMPSVVINYYPNYGSGGGGGGSSGGSSSDGGGSSSSSTAQSGGSSGNSGPVAQSGISSSGSSSSAGGQSGGSANQPEPSQGSSSSQNQSLYALRTDGGQGPTTGKAPATPTASSDVNDPTALPGAGTEPGMSTFDSHLMKSLQHTFEWLYLLLLLLVLIYLTYKYRKWVQRKLAKLRVKKGT